MVWLQALVIPYTSQALNLPFGICSREVEVQGRERLGWHRELLLFSGPMSLFNASLGGH